MENERFKERIRRVAGASLVILSLYLLLLLYLCGRDFHAGFVDGYHSEEGTAKVLTLSFVCLFAVAVAAVAAVVNSFRLLLGMRKGETPFSKENGRRIRRTGAMLMLMELLLWLPAGEFSGMHGVGFAAGLVMYNVSLLFDYGAHLQQESDETL